MPSAAAPPPPPPYTPPPSDGSVSSFTGSDPPPPPPPPLQPVDTGRLPEPEPEPEPEIRSPQQQTAQRVPPSLARLLEPDGADAPALTVTFAAPGPLGMTLVEHGEIKVVDRIAPGKQADQRTALRPGLLVDTVQGIAASTMSMGEVGELLQQRPVTVSFVSRSAGVLRLPTAATATVAPTCTASYRDSVHIEPARNMELSIQARLSTEQALSRFVVFTQRAGLHELGACATAALEFLLLHGASCLSAGPVHALEMLLEPLLCVLTTSGSAEMMDLALPAVHGLLPYVYGAMMDAQMPTAEGFPFLVTVIESLAEGVSCALSFHGAGALLNQLLHALSLVFGMMSPHHLSRDTLSMLVLALFRVMLRASATPASPAGATVSSSRLSELLAPTDALFQRLGAITFGWLAATTTPLRVASAARAVRADTAGHVDWVQLEESLSQFVSQPPAGSPGLLGEGVLTDADVEGWLSATSSSAAAGRPALQLIAALGKLMMYEMPVRRSSSMP
jgi:spore coat protein U-like protein